MWIRPRPRSKISSTWLVRVLARSGDGHTCTACGSRMFVASRDGLCPVCRREDQHRDTEIARIVQEQIDSVMDGS